MAYNQQIKDAVRSTYIYKALSLKDCARLNEVPYNTVRAWKSQAQENNDDWDTARNAARMASGGMTEITNMLLEHFAVNASTLMKEVEEDEKLNPQQKVDIMSKLSDSYSKLNASAAKSGTKIAPLAVAMNVLKMLTEFIKEFYPQHAHAFMEILEPFGRQVAEELG